jgi:hypothetical protein
MVGTVIRPLLSSNWSNASICGSRAANWNNRALNRNSNIGAQGVTETKGQTLRLAVSTRPIGRIHYGGSLGLVGRPDARGSIFL